MFTPKANKYLHKSYSFDNKYNIIEGLNVLPIQVEGHAGFKRLMALGAIKKIEANPIESPPILEKPEEVEEVKKPARRGRKRKTPIDTL